MVQTFHAGSTGTEIDIAMVEANAPLSLAGKTLTMLFQRPDETRFTRTAVVAGDPADGVMRYVNLATEFDLVGSWKRQGKVEDGITLWYSDWIDFELLPNLT